MRTSTKLPTTTTPTRREEEIEKSEHRLREIAGRILSLPYRDMMTFSSLINQYRGAFTGSEAIAIALTSMCDHILNSQIKNGDYPFKYDEEEGV